jgi:methylmalonyl-CoA mutase N-terminal domain/subunit
MFRFHTQTGGVTLTSQQPDNNIVRTALQALSAVLGGTQSLHTNSLDEALGLPTERAAEIALRTQQIIAHETGVGDTIDPLGGSFYIEQMTDELEAEAVHYIEQIDALGGAVSAIEHGFQKRAITEAAYALQRDVERETRAAHASERSPGTAGTVKVGVNRFQTDEPNLTETLHIDPDVARRQIEKLERVRADRNAAAVRTAIDQIAQAASGTDNLLPPILNAVRAQATLGEIAASLRSVWGEHRETSVV